MSDLELRLQCDCQNPYEFLWVGLDLQPPWTGKKDVPELWFRGQFYHGKLKQRIKNAWKYILRGEYRASLDFVFFGREHIQKLHDFTTRCLQEIDKKSASKP